METVVVEKKVYDSLVKNFPHYMRNVWTKFEKSWLASYVAVTVTSSQKEELLDLISQVV